MNERQHTQRHTLVAHGQVVQHGAHGIAGISELHGRNGGKVVVLVLLVLPAGDVGFHRKCLILNFFERFVRGDRLNVDGKDEVTVQLGQLLDEAVLQIGRIVLEKQHPANLVVGKLKVVGMELDAVRADGVFERVAALCHGIKVEMEPIFLADAEEIVQNAQTVAVVLLEKLRTQLFHVVCKVTAHAGEKAARFLNAAALDRNRDVAILHDTVSLSGLIQQHTVVLPAVVIAPVLFGGHEHFFLELQRIQVFVDDGDLRDGVCRQALFQRAVFDERVFLIFLVRYGVVDVGEPPATAEFAVHLPDTVPIDAANRNRLLGGFRQTHGGAFLFRLQGCFLHLRFLPFFVGVCSSLSYRFSLL